jgi:uncharacterized repeat protein (TIGR01451 family)
MRLEKWWAIAMACALSACGGSGGSSDADSAAHVVLAATGPSGLVANGSAAVLDVVVTNTGTLAATNVVTTFFAFAEARLTAIDCSASGGAVCPFSSQKFSLASPAAGVKAIAPTLPPLGSLHFRVTEFLQSVVSGPKQTTFSVTVDGQTAGADAQANVVVSTYIVQLSVSGGALTPTVAAGGMATYVMSLSNAGPDAASNLVVTNDVGLHQTLVSATCVAAGGAVCPTTASNGAVMLVPSVPVGGSLVFTINAAVALDATGLISDVFSAIGPGDRFGADNVRVATTEATSSASGSFLILRSDPGEPLGQGAAYAYTQADAFITASNDEDNLLVIGVDGNELWRGLVRFPGTPGRLQPGTYAFATLPAPGTAGLFSWSGNAAGCSDERTQLVIDSVAYSGATLSAIDLRFDHTCQGSTAVLHGQLHWIAADTTQPPGPVNPAPPALWRAPAGSTPSSGNYIYLASDAGDFIGDGKTAVLTQANAIFSVRSALPGQLNIGVQADDNVTATFRGVTTQTQLRPGYYGPIQSWPGANPAIGSMSWDQGGRGCNGASGWFVIDDVSYAGAAVASIDARFEQHCENALAALRGQIHWVPGDPTVPPGPVSPPPADLWSPAAGATPAFGNYVYLQSDAGDFVGKGGTYLLTPSNATITATATGADLKIITGPDVGFDGEFVGMNSIPQLQPGYYDDLERFPFNNPTKGGLTASALFSGCNSSSGWFVVDGVSYAGGTLRSIDLRFEQHCEGAVPALRGKIHWTSG